MAEHEQPGDWGAGAGASASLLDRIVRLAMDEDYALVAARRGHEPVPRPRRWLWVAVVALGALLAAAVAQTQRAAPALAVERSALVAQIEARSAGLEVLRQRASVLRQSAQAQQARLLTTVGKARTVNERLTLLAVSTGAEGVTGPGVRVVVDDAPGSAGRGQVRDTDLQFLVNGLWQAGAEAIAIDGHRLTVLTAIRGAGQAITVGYASLTPPYVIDVIGDPDTLPARFLETAAGQTWLSLQANLGLRLTISSRDALTLPGDTSLGACCLQAVLSNR